MVECRRSARAEDQSELAAEADSGRPEEPHAGAGVDLAVAHVDRGVQRELRAAARAREDEARARVHVDTQREERRDVAREYRRPRPARDEAVDAHDREDTLASGEQDVDPHAAVVDDRAGLDGLVIGARHVVGRVALHAETPAAVDAELRLGPVEHQRRLERAAATEGADGRAGVPVSQADQPALEVEAEIVVLERRQPAIGLGVARSAAAEEGVHLLAQGRVAGGAVRGHRGTVLEPYRHVALLHRVPGDPQAVDHVPARVRLREAHDRPVVVLGEIAAQGAAVLGRNETGSAVDDETVVHAHVGPAVAVGGGGVVAAVHADLARTHAVDDGEAAALALLVGSVASLAGRDVERVGVERDTPHGPVAHVAPPALLEGVAPVVASVEPLRVHRVCPGCTCDEHRREEGDQCHQSTHVVLSCVGGISLPGAQQRHRARLTAESQIQKRVHPTHSFFTALKLCVGGELSKGLE